MVSLLSLWLPILLSAVFVFLLSSVLHMVMTYHRSDFRGVPNEEAVQAALRQANIPPGDYMLPHAETPADMKSPEFQARWKAGPTALITVTEPSDEPSMGAELVQWFIFSLVIALFAGYIASRAVPPGGEYGEVFRFAATTAFLGFAGALWHTSIWYKRSWGTTLRSTFDALLYALLIGGTFGWLWPG